MALYHSVGENHKIINAQIDEMDGMLRLEKTESIHGMKYLPRGNGVSDIPWCFHASFPAVEWRLLLLLVNYSTLLCIFTLPLLIAS